jgi:hypothetical protein
MTDPGAWELALVESFPDLMSGRLAAARLESEGIPARLEGEPLGPYPVTVGGMAVTRVWVPANRLAEARQLLGQPRDPRVPADGETGELSEPARSMVPIWGVALVVAALLAARVLYWLF